jgi:Short C-terminal domain
MGLLRGVARTAVIAGTASAVSGRVQRRQAERYADRDAQIYEQRGQAYAAGAAGYEAQQAAPPPAAPAEDPTITKLKQLAELHSQGVLTDDEFSAQKAKLLSS